MSLANSTLPDRLGGNFFLSPLHQKQTSSLIMITIFTLDMFSFSLSKAYEILTR